MQWTTVRLVVSENDGRRHDREKTHRGGERISASQTRGDETRELGLEEDRTLKQWAECRDKNGAVLSRWERLFS